MRPGGVPTVVVVASDPQAWQSAATVYRSYSVPTSLLSESEQRILVGDARAEVAKPRSDELTAIRDAIMTLVVSPINDAASQELAKQGRALNADLLVVVSNSDVFAVDVARAVVSKLDPASNLVASLKAFISVASPAGPNAPPTGPVLPPPDLIITSVPRASPGVMVEKVEDLAATEPLPAKGPTSFEPRPIEVQREYVRGAIAISLVGALILTIVLFLLGDMFDHPVDGAKLNGAITALVGLVGSATGFYFGSQTSSQPKP